MNSPIDRLSAALSDRYRIDRELGAGGMATVYLAHDLKHDRDVALKVLKPDLSASLGRERFLREIQLAAKLSHPHILPLFDSGEADGLLFYVMPNVQGQSLRDRLDAEGKLPVADAVRIAEEVAGALDHAHRHGVVHRDIKPENIMLQDGHAMVADFGIGKAVSDIAGATLTQVGVSIGTPTYMSPEQAVGEEVDGRSDLYSLGCVLYEMLAGEPPFTGPNAQAIITKRFIQIPTEITALREGVPRPIARALQRSLNRTPTDRHSTAAELLAALREVDAVGASAASSAPAHSIAVLPFENLSSDRENEYFGDGIAEDVISALTRIEGLHVAAKTSAFFFKGKHEELATIGAKLNVATVLQGSVRRSGNRARITTQLVSVADGYHLWSERFDRDVTDMFVVQDEIAGAIAARLELTLLPPATVPAPLSPAQVQAYDLVTKGRALLQQRGSAVLGARDAFERAIAVDPLNARAHAALGDTLRVMVQYGLLSADEAVPLAFAALERALDIDPDCAEALGTLGVLQLVHQGQPQLGISTMERALAIDPRLSVVRVLYAVWGLMCALRDDERGLVEMRRAASDDPLSALVAVTCGGGLALIGHFDEAKAEARRAIALDDWSFAAHALGTAIFAWAGDADTTLELAARAIEKFGRHPMLLQHLPWAYLAKGDRKRGEAIYDELKARAISGSMPHYALAVAAFHLGYTQDGFREARLSAEARDGIGPLWSRAPGLEALRAHPEYSTIVKIMGFE